MPATQQKAPKEKVRKSGKCPLCGKYIKRGFTVHMKGHQDYNNWDYNCKFKVLGQCKTYKNTLSSPAHCLFHMFTQHFKFDDYKVPRSPNIDDLLKHTGECGCGYNNVAKDWLYEHVLTDECPLTQPGAKAPPPTQFKCSVCDRTFYRSKDWYKHFAAHRGSWDLNCKFRHLGKCGLYHGPSKIAHVCIEHMLNAHFVFDTIEKPSQQLFSSLLRETGRCKCGYHGVAKTWVDEHVLGDECPLIRESLASEAGQEDNVDKAEGEAEVENGDEAEQEPEKEPEIKMEDDVEMEVDAETEYDAEEEPEAEREPEIKKEDEAEERDEAGNEPEVKIEDEAQGVLMY